MTSSIKISIIVPNYNHHKYLVQRLDSIFNQTYTDFEVILLDDASTDNSVKILEAYATRSQVSHFIVNSENSGSPFLQWKRGIKLAKGKYIWIAESDDYCDESFLQKTVKRLDEENSKLIYTDSNLIDGLGQISDQTFNEKELSKIDNLRWKSSYYSNGMEELTELFIHQTTIPNASAVVFERELTQYIPWDLICKMKLVGDKLFWAICLAQSYISYLNEPLNFHRHHAQTQRSRTDFPTWYFENLSYLHHLSREVPDDKITIQRDFFLSHYLTKVTDYSLNLFKLIPHLKQLYLFDSRLFIKLIYPFLPKSIGKTLKTRLLKLLN